MLSRAHGARFAHGTCLYSPPGYVPVCLVRCSPVWIALTALICNRHVRRRAVSETTHIEQVAYTVVAAGRGA